MVHVPKKQDAIPRVRIRLSVKNVLSALLAGAVVVDVVESED